jgi:hypothetical protein
MPASRRISFQVYSTNRAEESRLFCALYEVQFGQTNLEEIMFRLIRRIREYFAREAARHKKLEMLFQPGNQVRSVSSGRVYSVAWVDMNAALLRSVSDTHCFILDWFTPAGTIRTEVADCWDLVPA